MLQCTPYPRSRLFGTKISVGCFFWGGGGWGVGGVCLFFFSDKGRQRDFLGSREQNTGVCHAGYTSTV